MVFCNAFVATVNQSHLWVKSHNPYFNRWFSAMTIGVIIILVIKVTILILIDGFLQYDNCLTLDDVNCCHNPYFNRWFSAIDVYKMYNKMYIKSQSLF